MCLVSALMSSWGGASAPYAPPPPHPQAGFPMYPSLSCSHTPWPDWPSNGPSACCCCRWPQLTTADHWSCSGPSEACSDMPRLVSGQTIEPHWLGCGHLQGPVYTEAGWERYTHSPVRRGGFSITSSSACELPWIIN